MCASIRSFLERLTSRHSVVAHSRFIPCLTFRNFVREALYPHSGSRPDHRDNLFEPVPRDFGASGRFGAHALDEAIMMSAGPARAVTAMAGFSLFAALLQMVRRKGH